MGHIETVGDLIINFSTLYEFWTWQISNLFLSSSIKFDMQRMTKTNMQLRQELSIGDLSVFGGISESLQVQDR